MLPDGKTVGYIGEHNATTLEITPPDYMLSDGVSLFCLAVETGREFIKAVVRSAMVPKADKISIPLWRQATGSSKAKLQLEAYDDGGNLLIKSPVAEVEFLPSVNGVQNVSETNSTSIVADIAANTAARHTHENADTLGKLGDSNGSLTYDGKAVGGGNETNVVILTAEEWDIEASMNPEKCTFVFAYNTNKIPENAEIANVEIKVGTDEIGNPIWKSVEDSFFDSNANPFYYFQNRFIKRSFDTFGNGYILFSIYSPFSKNDFILELEGYVFTDIRVRYYI